MGRKTQTQDLDRRLGPYDLSSEPRAPAGRRRLLGGAFSVLSHLAILVAVLSARADRLKMADAPAMTVALIDGRTLTPTPTPTVTPAPTPAPAATPAPTQAPPAQPAPRKNNMRRSPAPPQPDSLSADDDPTAQAGPELSAAQLAGAASASAGPPGGACDIARLLQGALRRDPLVQAAVAGSAGKAIMVWNGDWVRSRGEDGKGLAAVRESIIWEIGFAPEACRSKPVHGLILLSLNDGPGSARLAMGSGEWRWSDLLGPRPAGAASTR